MSVFTNATVDKRLSVRKRSRGGSILCFLRSIALGKRN